MVMGRRGAYERAGLFQARFGFVSDVDMWLRLAEEYDVAYVPETLIALPNRHTLPREWGTFFHSQERRTVRRIFWESRLRHYRERPVRRASEVLRHGCYTAMDT